MSIGSGAASHSQRIFEQKSTRSVPPSVQDAGWRRREILRHIAELPDDAVLDVQEVAVWLLVEPAWVRAHANGNRRPRLPVMKMGKFQRFLKGDIVQFLRELKSQAKGHGC